LGAGRPLHQDVAEHPAPHGVITPFQTWICVAMRLPNAEFAADTLLVLHALCPDCTHLRPTFPKTAA
jgi:hypothetical protein